MVESCRESDRPHQVVKTHSEDEDQVSDDVCFEDEAEEEEEEEDHEDDDDGDLKTDCAGGALALAHKPGELRPSFGSVVVNNSSDVHFGTKAFYNGPVTIKQFVYTSKNGSVDVRHGVTDSEDAVKNDNIPTVNGSLSPIWQPSPNEEEQKPEETQWRFVKKWRILLIIACTSLLLIIITLVAVFFAIAPVQQSSSNAIEDAGVNFKYEGTDNTPSGKLRIISRKEWLAQPPVHPADPLKHPVPYVVILHTATESCSTQAQCVFFVRHTQTFHIESNGWWDIAYSFLVGGDGNVYEGRGWDGVGAFAYGYNNVSIGISFIGTFISELPPPKQIAAGKALIAEGVRLGKISKDYKIFAHRQLSPTESPGLAFYENIKTWDHWAEKPSS